MSKITVSYAGTTLANKNYTQIKDVLADQNLKAVLGFGNVEAQIDGVTQPLDAYLSEDDVVVLQNKANEKA